MLGRGPLALRPGVLSGSWDPGGCVASALCKALDFSGSDLLQTDAGGWFS